jgi:hypothetical protein
MKCLSCLVLSVMALPVFAQPAAQPKPAKSEIAVDFEYVRNGTILCRGTKTITSGETFLVCEATLDGNRTFVRLTPKVHGPGQIEVRGEAEEVAPDGHVVELSRPMILVLDGEPASIKTGNISPQGVETSSLTMNVTARRL